MQKIELGEVQERFANIIWELEPIKSMELMKICKERLEWNKSTTFTVLRKLCEKGLFKNENGVVTSLMSKEEFAGIKSRQFVQEHFKGSLPAFLAAFVSDKTVSEKEADEIRSMIDDYKKSLN
ncbi:MAG: BlaI/MecI/CopY family transcriptional regulator [Lachnospiraceae bacterium]|nr:BlaI/MecI/CopY family transcriptional regulator [Lachnospiraceae bacterium]